MYGLDLYQSLSFKALGYEIHVQSYVPSIISHPFIKPASSSCLRSLSTFLFFLEKGGYANLACRMLLPFAQGC